MRFFSSFLGTLPIRSISYREAFAQYANLDYTKDFLPKVNDNWSRTETLHYILSHQIEPNLGISEITVLTDYPPYEAALARVEEKQGELVAKRFEIYHQGVELANGYHELSSSFELKQRFDKENKARISRGQEPYLLDEEFLASLERLPNCCGVSVGFDRAFMLQQKASSLHSAILPL